jgi:hypothetical protein
MVRDLDILRPSARIFDLRRDGYNIATAWSWDRVNGTDHRVGRYVLLPKEPDPGKAKGPTGTQHTDEAHKQRTTATKTTRIAAEMASFAALAVIVTWALGSAVLGMAGGMDDHPGASVMLAGVDQHGR